MIYRSRQGINPADKSAAAGSKAAAYLGPGHQEQLGMGHLWVDGSGPGTIWTPYKNNVGLATLSPMSKAQVVGWGALMPRSASPWEPGGAGLQDSSLSSVPFSFVALLGGAAGWGPCAGISDHRGTVWREAADPRVGFQGTDNSVGLDLKIALEIATTSLALISKTSKRYLLPIHTLLITQRETQ